MASAQAPVAAASATAATWVGGVSSSGGSSGSRATSTRVLRLRGGTVSSGQPQAEPAGDPLAGVAAEDRKRRELVIQGFERKSGLGKRTAEALERGVFKVACPNGEALSNKDTFKEYSRQYKRLCTHLRQNATLGERLNAGDLSGEAVAAMEDEALLSEALRSERDQFRQEGLQEAMGLAAEQFGQWTPSDDWECPVCHNTKCVYLQIVRGFHSYDDNNQEPVITIRCTECKHLWKEDEVEGGRGAAGTFVLDGGDAPAAAKVGAADEQASMVAVPSDKKEPALAMEEVTLHHKAPLIWGKTGETWMLPAGKADGTV
eukprot:TRINITY_DN111186_c0_g1_i1.p1 TRINITY_DN111186_c0_g1~~TRINITY_DN111186_c0_g1_i1.p1  ORF type:complete len:317 (-),score=70.65 TRINITY_DN111186_c0_g1_i1:44-994(-)